MKAKVLLQNNSPLEVLVGNEKILRENGCNVSIDITQRLKAWQLQGKSVVLVAIRKINPGSPDVEDYKIAALLAVADPLRPEAHFVFNYFKSKGIATYIVSGDGSTTVEAVGATLDLPSNHIIGGALPEDKRQFVEQLQNQMKEVRCWNGKLQKQRRLVAFVGDGINDSIGRQSCI